LFFREVRHGDRKARERLFKLYEGRRLKRCRVALTEPYCYYVGVRHGRLEHLLALNWVFVWLSLGLKAWEQMHCFNYEVDFGVLQADALAAVRNTVTGRFRVWLVEMDRGTDGFDKVVRYNRLYGGEGYADAWWAPLVDRFPPILVATSGAKRAARIQEHIRRENTHGLQFDLRLLGDLRRDCLDNYGLLRRDAAAGAVESKRSVIDAAFTED
jgi:hypothetical protein